MVQETIFFKDEEIRGVNLQLVYDFLSTISPSNVESETALSSESNMYIYIDLFLK
jgi:hypothetical protein